MFLVQKNIRKLNRPTRVLTEDLALTTITFNINLRKKINWAQNSVGFLHTTKVKITQDNFKERITRMEDVTKTSQFITKHKNT